MNEASWEDFPLPDEWSDSEKQATLNARKFFSKLASPEFFGSDLAAAKALGWKRADSIYQVCKGVQKPGKAMLQKIYQAGFDPSEVFPDHPYSIALQQGKQKQLSVIPLDLDAFCNWNHTGVADDTISGFVSGSTALPARYFCIEMPDNKLEKSKGVTKGALVLLDPDQDPEIGKVVLVEKKGKLDIQIYTNKIPRDSVKAVAFSATMRATVL